MYKIYKITSNHVVDFAAEELKKYLRMMMPRCGEITIDYAPEAKDGFRLGLMQDFGLDVSEARDTYLDDIVHIDTDENGGIIAGDNPRSVLLAVYKYLTLNGCRWLFPGVDGELIPTKDIESVSYHKLADNRFRGQCNEGAEYQPNMMEVIDFTPKIGMNIFMIEFDNPKVYYDRYYNHKYNDTNREPEPVNPEITLQWKRECEVELAKRGLQLHDIGHGWTAEAFGIDTTDGWVAKSEDIVPEDAREFVAMTGGERKLWGGVAINTNFCMSRADARAKVVKKVADYAELYTNVDYLHVWLADSSKNHCECDQCRKLTPSDWYVVLMNDIDDELTRRSLPTRIVFCQYVDTNWAPLEMKINNPDRFSKNLGAISRDYTESVDPTIDFDAIPTTLYELNTSPLPASINEYIAYHKQWLKMTPVSSFLYEYHFWVAQYYDIGLLDSARVIYDDIRGYHALGFDGIIEDGSQRSFLQNGLSFYVYANTLFDVSVDFDALVEDYFSHAYGEDWRNVVEFFKKLGKMADFRYLNGKLSLDYSKSKYYNPDFAAEARGIPALVDEFMPFVVAHKNMPKRSQTVAYRILRRYLEFCKGVSKILVLRAAGLGPEAREENSKFLIEFGKYELELDRYYDQFLFGYSLVRGLFGQRDAFDPV